MRVQRFATVDAFMAAAGEFLVAREAEHNLVLGLCSTIQADPTSYGDLPPYLASVVDGGRVIGVAVRTPPWRLVLSTIDDQAVPAQFVADLVGEELPGAQGPTKVADGFAREWSRITGRSARPLRGLRAFSVAAVTPPRPAPGRMVAATVADHAVVAEWLHAFHVESLPETPARDFSEHAMRWIRGQGRRLVLWVDAGRPVALTGIGGATPNGIRIGPVYTPPELRGRGYASNLVAGATQQELDAGRRFVFLFTDLANATANHIYQAIGYEPVADFNEYGFS